MAVKEHPIPQSITTYKFRLVGNMTLQQFFEVAGGIIIAFIVWRSPVYPVIKYPLAIFSASLGVAMAFLPIEERSLDVWILAFIKHIYKPTVFIFKSQPHTPLYARFKPRPKKIQTIKLRRPSATRPTLITHSTQGVNPKLTEYVNHLFDQIPTPSPPPSPTKPKIIQPTHLPIAGTTTKPKITPKPKTPPSPQKTTPKALITPIKSTATKPARVVSGAKPVFDADLPKTQQPNTLSGIVIDPQGKPLPTSLIEVKSTDSDIPLRITKANPLGHFFFTNPLPNGRYIIEVEREGYQFKPISLDLSGQVIKPIKITGQPTTSQPDSDKKV